MDSSVSSTTLSYDDLEDKMKGTYELSPGKFEESYSIVKTEPGQFEVYIDSCLKENELWETCPYIKEVPTEDWI